MVLAIYLSWWGSWNGYAQIAHCTLYIVHDDSCGARWVCISFECINVTSFMQYAYYVQFNTSFNTLQPIYVLHLRKNDKRLFSVWVNGRDDNGAIITNCHVFEGQKKEEKNSLKYLKWDCKLWVWADMVYRFFFSKKNWHRHIVQVTSFKRRQ